MRHLIPIFFVALSLLSVSSARTAHADPLSQNQLVLQATPGAVTTATSDTEVPARTGPPLSLTLTLLGMCCVFSVFIGVVVLGFVARNPKNQGENNSNL